jgi:hypothetical protein
MLRQPLNQKTLHHIASQCKTSAKRQAFLRREIEIVRQNVAYGRFGKLWACHLLDVIKGELS